MKSMDKEVQFEREIKNVCRHFLKNDASYDIVVKDEEYEKFKRIINKYGMSYCVRQSQDYTKKDRRRISWSTSNIPFFKVPFVVEFRSFLECVNGPKKNRTNQNHAKSQLEQHHDHPEKNKRSRLQPSKKKGCNAIMEVTVIKQYPDFELKGIKNKKDEKAEIMKSLKKELDCNAASIRTQTMYHISFSAQSVHCHSVSSNLTNQKLDPSVAGPVPNIDESDGRIIVEVLASKSQSSTGNSEAAVNVTEVGISSAVPSSDSLISVAEPVPSISESDGGIIVEIVHASELLSLTENSVPTFQIRELIKNVYDQSFLLSSPNCRNSVAMFNKLHELINLLNNSIDCQDNIPLLPSSDSVSELPGPKKCKRK